jgi:ATP-dependent DNA helicase RecG
MRPEILFTLFAPLTKLPGVGPRLAPLIERLVGGPHVVDLLWHLPVQIIDRSHTPKIAEAQEGMVATLVVQVDAHLPPPPRSPRLPYKVRCRDATGFMHLVFFHAKGDWVARALPVGAVRAVSGRIERFRDEIQMTHPDYIVGPDELASLATVEPVYGLTAGVTPKVLGKAMKAALGMVPALDEWIDPALLAREKWQSWSASIRAVHTPENEADLSPLTVVRRRLAYDELLSNQLALAVVRAHQRRQRGRTLRGDGSLRKKVVDALPFALTGAQRMALAEIEADMGSDRRMIRLLQGDVGSGKTVVALLAMLNAVETGAQAALMAPTEILARQHYATIEPLAAAARVPVALLTGRDKGKPRQRILEGLASGSIPIVVGTHALFQDDVAFRDLALAVIDEQHRFGVHQRLGLASKGDAIDMLVMTATPIPRTLLLCSYGDMDVSRLTEKPPGRLPVDTRVVPLSRTEEVLEGVARQIRAGAKVFWVCPMVEESEAIDLAAATERHVELSARFGAERVVLVHGKMKPMEKDRAMERFAEGDASVLVATTVIEVGVNVPAATVMVIEHAERFGLAQLHQLRGRIGRGDKPSTCVLLYGTPLSETAKARLSILRETEDGFRIAEEDLRLRGAGEVLGTRQSGLPEFRLADLAVHADLMEIARDDARLALERDPNLSTPRGRALVTLLYLFERDAAVRLLQAG